MNVFLSHLVFMFGPKQLLCLKVVDHVNSSN